MAKHGILIVISAPSGAGKLTLLNKVRETKKNLATTISATTRAPRKGEVDGKDYYFLSLDEFKQRIAAEAFVEWAEVHDNLYGTLKAELDRCLALGEDVILEVDVQGMRALRAQRQDLVTIFLMPPSLEELERRLRHRGTDDPEVIALRLHNAKEELAAKDEFDYIVVNDDIGRAAAEMIEIIDREHARRNHNPTGVQ